MVSTTSLREDGKYYIPYGFYNEFLCSALHAFILFYVSFGRHRILHSAQGQITLQNAETHHLPVLLIWHEHCTNDADASLSGMLPFYPQKQFANRRRQIASLLSLQAMRQTLARMNGSQVCPAVLTEHVLSPVLCLRTIRLTPIQPCQSIQ